MNSIIISAICAFFAGFVRFFKESGTYKLFMKIYTAVSGWWRDSIIMTFLRKNEREDMSNKSFLYRFLYIPFEILDFINKRCGTVIKKWIDESIVLRLIRCYTNNALSLNTRFYGTILLVAAAAFAGSVHSFSMPVVIAAIMGLIFILINLTVTDFFAGSMFVSFCESVIGFKNIKWSFYNKEDVNSRSAITLAVISGALIGALAAKSPLLALALPCGIVGMSTVLIYPVSGVFFAVIAAPFVPTLVLAALCLLTFGALVIKSVITPGFKWKLDGVGTGLGLFLVFMLVSSAFSFARGKSLMVWAMYLVFVGFYFVIINTVETKKQLFSLLKVFVIAGAAVSIYGVLQYIFGWNTSNAWIDENMFEEATMRAYSTMENPNVLGEYLLLLIPLSAVFVIKPSFKKLEKWFYIAVFLLSALCMVFTQSRGCWLGLILSAVIFVTFYNGKIWGLLPVLLVMLPFIVPQTMVERMMSIGNMEDSSTSYRVFIWLGTFGLLKDFWLGGIGMGEGAFTKIYPFYSYNAIVAPHSHNTFFQLMVEGGVCALAIFVVTMIVFVKKMSVVYIKKTKSSMEGITALAISSGVIGFLLQSMFDYTFYNYRMMAMFFMILAMGVSLNFVGKEAA